MPLFRPPPQAPHLSALPALALPSNSVSPSKHGHRDRQLGRWEQTPYLKLTENKGDLGIFFSETKSVRGRPEARLARVCR